MSDDPELVRGSGNVFCDFNCSDAEIRQAKCILAAEILKTLDDRRWSTRQAQEVTGVDHADFARIRRVNIGRFSLERLMKILGALGQEVELSVQIRPRAQPAKSVTAHP